MDNNKVNVILQLGWKAKEDILKKMPTSAVSTSSVVSSTASVTSTAAHLTTVSTTPTTAAGTVTSVDKEAENTPVSSLTDSSSKPSVITNLLEVLEITFISFFVRGFKEESRVISRLLSLAQKTRATFSASLNEIETRSQSVAFSRAFQWLEVYLLAFSKHLATLFAVDQN